MLISILLGVIYSSFLISYVCYPPNAFRAQMHLDAAKCIQGFTKQSPNGGQDVTLVCDHAAI